MSAMMSEDSDYTSDVNYPTQHQHNMSAHQYGGRQGSPPYDDDQYIDDIDHIYEGGNYGGHHR